MNDKEKDYKHTLNLPQTAFPMKANLAGREPDTLKFWHELDLYARLRRARAGKPKYILHDGPPYANGDIHLGHAVNKVLKDIIVKAKTLSGYDAPYVPGWDCHGLPIELMVEKKIGKAGDKVNPAAFRKACREYAAKQVDGQRADFQRLGIIGDWEHPYLTMDFQFEADIIRELGRVVARDHLYKSYKPVHWCIDCGSALAEAEVEYEDKTSPAIDVKFAVADNTAFWDAALGEEHQPSTGGRVPFSSQRPTDKPVYFVIWTTTPWTLPANQAVAVNAEQFYDIVDVGNEYLVLASPLAEIALGRYGYWPPNNNINIKRHTIGATFEGLLLRHPFYDREVPVLLGEHVTMETGTGAVHTAPGHGQEDYRVAMYYNRNKGTHIKIDNPVGGDGKFLPDTELFAGEHVFKANDHVIEVLKARAALLHVEMLRHSYPHCWRHKTPIIFRATPQWFIGMERAGLRNGALAEIKQITWLPDWGQARIEGMITGRPDWCISRQRTWGVPITLFTHKQTGKLHPDTQAIIEKVAQRVEQKGIDAWFELEPQELLGAQAADYDKVNDTLDVWFDSGVTHACVLAKRPELQYPADLYLEGSDQHRGWFQSSLLSAVATRASAPYKMALTHGFTVDAKGKKMSKSLGNTILPQKVINTLGADVLRLWIAATDYRNEMSISDEILTRVGDSYRRIRNTARYLLGNLSGFDPAQHALAPDKMLALDAWALNTCADLQHQLCTAYEDFNFHLVYQKLHQFCSVELGSFYLDVLKDRVYTTPADSNAHRSAQTAMYHILEALVRWMAPVLSFTAEEIWKQMPGQRDASVFLDTWYVIPHGDDTSGMRGREYWDKILKVREQVGRELEQARVAGLIGSSLDAEVDIYCDPSLKTLLDGLQDELRFVLIVSYARVHDLVVADTDSTVTEISATAACVALPPASLPSKELRVKVSLSAHAKCIRCWHHRADVGCNAQHQHLCARCVLNVTGSGESRRYA